MVRTTAAGRGSPRRSRKLARGARAKLSRTESARGFRTSEARDMNPITAKIRKVRITGWSNAKPLRLAGMDGIPLGCGGGVEGGDDRLDPGRLSSVAGPDATRFASDWCGYVRIPCLNPWRASCDRKEGRTARVRHARDRLPPT